MDAYIEALEATLKQAARRQHRQRPRAHTRRKLLRLTIASAVVLTITVVALGALRHSDSSDGVAEAAALPAFARPATNIADRGVKLPPTMAKGYDLRHARTFSTSKGNGYVVASGDGGSVCMAVPDPPAGYGATCAPIDEVLRRGLVGERVAPAPDVGRTEVVVLQGAAAPAPVLRDRTGQTRRLDVNDGIATSIITRPGTLTITGSDGPRAIAVRPFEPQGAIWVQCPDHRNVKVPSWRASAEARRGAVCGHG
jgi:hypothetical protein